MKIFSKVLFEYVGDEEGTIYYVTIGHVCIFLVFLAMLYFAVSGFGEMIFSKIQILSVNQ